MLAQGQTAVAGDAVGLSAAFAGVAEPAVVERELGESGQHHRERLGSAL